MRSRAPFCLILVCLLTAACGSRSSSGSRVYTMQGQVLTIDAARRMATIRHEEIRGFMPAMTMPYEAREPKLLDGIAPGDLITAELTVGPSNAYLTAIRKVGSAPLEAPPAAAAPASPPRPELIKAGEAAPDGAFVDQNGKPRPFRSFKGHRVVLTFIYTRCPMPTFCPLMDRHFATIQASLRNDPALKDVRLVSVSFDPATDTPPVLAKHAKEVGADPAVWTFLTGDEPEIDRFAARFGVSVEHDPNDPQQITHNLRTAVIGADGTLLQIYSGNEWTPDQVLGVLRARREQGAGGRD